MATKKGPRVIVGLKCASCGAFNYITERNKLNTPEKLKLRKYCKRERKYTEHSETSKLK